MESSVDERNRIFDEIIKARRSIRDFKEEKPPKEYIKEIIEAGMLAPYAAATVGSEKDFRRFFVFESGTSSFDTLVLLIKKSAAQGAEHLDKLVEEKPFMKSKVESFAESLHMIADEGVPGLRTAPYFVVAAELKGIPSSEQASLAHVLENMWLKATALDLGFQLVSITSQLSENDEFINLLEIPPGKFALNGCALGYPAITPPPKPRPDVHEATRWLE